MICILYRFSTGERLKLRAVNTFMHRPETGFYRPLIGRLSGLAHNSWIISSRDQNMKGYTAALETGEAIYYVDRKRWLWSMSVLYPLQPFIGIWLHSVTGNEGWLLFRILSYMLTISTHCV